MHVIFITSEFFPYVGKTALAEESVCLAKAFKQAGHQVTTVIPCVSKMDFSSHSLARRLSPVKASAAGREFSCRRYDGRTADGVLVNFLDLEEGDVDRTSGEVLSAAAAALVGSFSEAPGLCISFGADLAGFSEAARQYPRLSDTVLAASLREINDSEAPSVPCADRILVSRLARVPSSPEVAARFAVIPSAAPSVEIDAKPSEKTAFQMKAGFAVRSDVPLTMFCEFTKEALTAHLEADVQAVVFDNREDCLALKERYPDRLKSVPEDSLTAVLRAADACVFGADASMVSLCAAHSVLPVTTAARDTVDLEPSLASGTGIVMSSLDTRPAVAALSRLVAAFHNREAFKALALRLPKYAVTWPRVVSYILNLVEEVKTENQ